MKRMLALILSAVCVLTALTGCTYGSVKTKEETPELVRGVWTDNTYHSDFASLTVTLDDSWNHASDTEVAAIMKLDEETSNDPEAYLKAISKKGTVYDMLADNLTSRDTIAVAFESLHKHSNVDVLTEEDYLTEVTRQLKEINTISYTYDDTYDVTLGSTTYRVLPAAYENGDKSGWQYYLVKKRGLYMVVILVTTMSDEPLDPFLAYFS